MSKQISLEKLLNCIEKCLHPRATDWVECKHCQGWYHQICVGLKVKKKRPIKFICAMH